MAFDSHARRGLLLWIVAFVSMLAAATYQRLTGPTFPARGTIDVTAPGAASPGGEDATLRYRLPRSGTTGTPRRVSLPAHPAIEAASLAWRRYPSTDSLRIVPMSRDGEGWTSALPSQPPAGKIEYEVRVATRDGRTLVLPPDAGRPVLRYKGPVPLTALIPHVAVMFVSMLFGVRAALAVIARRREARWLVPATAVGLTVGGLILGPIVQKHAFGAYWTGWPFGEDLTDNKTVAMWLAWVVAATVLVRVDDVRRSVVRITVVAATIVMLAVYLVPHSLRGSQLDYAALDRGVEAGDAIRTGDTESRR